MPDTESDGPLTTLLEALRVAPETVVALRAEWQRLSTEQQADQFA